MVSGIRIPEPVHDICICRSVRGKITYYPLAVPALKDQTPSLGNIGGIKMLPGIGIINPEKRRIPGLIRESPRQAVIIGSCSVNIGIIRYSVRILELVIELLLLFIHLPVIIVRGELVPIAVRP